MPEDRANGGNGAPDAGPGAPVRFAVPAPAAAPADAGPMGPERDGLTLRDYLAVLWRRKWVILIVVIVATASAWYFSDRQVRMYEASATMFFKQQLDLSNPLSSNGTYTYTLDREMATIGDLMAGPDVRDKAGQLIAAQGVDTTAGYSVSAAQQNSSTSSNGTSVGSNVVVVTATSSSPRLAAAAANAYMAAYISWDADQYRALIKAAIPVLESQLAHYKTKADQLTTDYLMLRQRLQDLQILRETASGSYRQLTTASVPTTPYAPKPLRSAILGFGIGLFAGIGLAFLLEQFDTRFRRLDEVSQILRQPILGRVPRIPRSELHDGALITLRAPSGHAAEAFRMVRTNLDFMAVDSEVKSIVITSCLKGEGKSVTAANLAVSMALAGKKVIVVDGDLRRPRQHTYFGLANDKGVSTVVAGKDELRSALQTVELTPPPDHEGRQQADFDAWAAGTDARSVIYVMPSGPIPPNPGEIVSSRRFSVLLRNLTREADMVIVDSPAMLAVGDTAAIAASVDAMVFLADVDMINRPQLMAAAEQLLRLPVHMLGVIVRVHHRLQGRYYYSPYYYAYSYTADGERTRDRRRRTYGRRSTDRPPPAAR